MKLNSYPIFHTEKEMDKEAVGDWLAAEFWTMKDSEFGGFEG